MESKPDRCVLLGAAGRDYFNFLQYFKDNPAFEVVCFTAAQIPGIEKRVFPKELAGKYYHKDIPIYSEERLAEITETSYKYIQRIEGKTPPDVRLTTVEKIAEALKTTPSKLLDN